MQQGKIHHVYYPIKFGRQRNQQENVTHTEEKQNKPHGPRNNTDIRISRQEY